jgi:hypothetical protein
MYIDWHEKQNPHSIIELNINQNLKYIENINPESFIRTFHID